MSHEEARLYETVVHKAPLTPSGEKVLDEQRTIHEKNLSPRRGPAGVMDTYLVGMGTLEGYFDCRIKTARGQLESRSICHSYLRSGTAGIVRLATGAGRWQQTNAS